MAIKLKRDSVLGFVFFGGLLLLLWATAALSDFSLGDKEQIRVRFPDARGVKVGDNVYVAGTRYGVVLEVDYQPKNQAYPIEMTLELDAPLLLQADYKIAITDASLLGGKQISIDPGRSPDFGELPLLGRSPANPLQALGDILGAEGNRENLQQILQNINDIVARLKDGEGTVGGAVVKIRDFFAKAEEVAGSIDLAVKDAREGKGPIGKVVAKAGDFFEKADDIANTVKTGDGLVPRLLSDKQLADNVDAAVANIETVTRDIKDGKGVLGKLINGSEWTAKVDGILDEAAKAAKAINEGDGLLAAALYDKELRDDLKGTVTDIRAVVADVRSGKGTVGRLLNDDTLIMDLEKLVNQIRRSVEDAREAAPVSTIVTIFTGAFQ